MSFQPPPDPALARWRRVEEICDAALRLDPSERDAYLADVCGADEALRREVEALLVHEETSQGFLSAPVGAIAARLLEPPRDLIGTRIADYDIVAKLGEGGMGEVYRARDRKLGRDVAIKVLPAAVANDQERLKRFEREARLLASVNHPAIGAIYGLVDAGDLRALVLELIEGETLAARLERGSLKLDRALALAAQICDALEHAHRRGVTHRDLKPSNVMLSDGGVKVLDFGVGKWASPATGAAVTRESTLTNEGAIVGTLHYMAPEQLEGRTTDARSDILSFGAVLYEMLSGRRAFDGPSQASIIAAVLEAPTPRLTGIGGALAPRLERVVSKCLTKRPEDRWQSAGDLGDELRWLGLETVDGPGAAPSPSSKPRRHTAIAAGLAASVAVFLVGWASNWRAEDSSLAASISFSEQTQDSRLDMGNFDLSNDGDQLLYATTAPGLRRLLNVRRFDRLDAIGLPGTETAISPVFSPDGEWVAFLTNDAPRTVRKMRLGAEATPVIVVGDAGSTFEIAWPTADRILVVGREQPIRKVPANGGRLEDMTTIQADTEIDHHGPVLLPSGNGLSAFRRARSTCRAYRPMASSWRSSSAKGVGGHLVARWRHALAADRGRRQLEPALDD